MVTSKTLMLVLALIAIAFAAGYFLSGVGRYEITLELKPGEHGRFLLLDSRSGDVYRCDRSACSEKPLR